MTLFAQGFLSKVNRKPWQNYLKQHLSEQLTKPFHPLIQIFFFGQIHNYDLFVLYIFFESVLNLRVNHIFSVIAKNFLHFRSKKEVCKQPCRVWIRCLRINSYKTDRGKITVHSHVID